MPEFSCPICSSSKVVPVLYGEPQAQPANDERIGGCVLAIDSPRWCCRVCGELWGRVGDYDFENLGTRLELAIETTMWSRAADHQWEALEVVRTLLAAPGVVFMDEDAEESRREVLAALGSEVTREATDALTDQQRDSLAEHLLHLLRYAERKASNG